MSCDQRKRSWSLFRPRFDGNEVLSLTSLIDILNGPIRNLDPRLSFFALSKVRVTRTPAGKGYFVLVMDTFTCFKANSLLVCRKGAVPLQTRSIIGKRNNWWYNNNSNLTPLTKKLQVACRSIRIYSTVFGFEFCVRNFKHAFGTRRLSKFRASRLSKCQNLQLCLWFWVMLSKLWTCVWEKTLS